MKNLLARLLNLKTEYERLFFKNEFAVFAGKNNKRLFRLLSILFITFLALSFAKGSYDYLYSKMNNPFTNWVNLPIKTDNYSKYKDEIKERFKSEALRDSFNLKPLTGYLTDLTKWYNKKGKRVYKRGRSVDAYDDILKAVLSESNTVWKKQNFKLTDTIDKKYYYDIIVTESFLKRLNYKLEDSLRRVKYANFDSNNNNVSFWVDLLAVVKDLPSKCDYIFFPNLYNSINNGIETGYPIVSVGKGNQFEILTKSSDTQSVTNEVIKALGKVGEDISQAEEDIEIASFKIAEKDQRKVYKFFFEDEEYAHIELIQQFEKYKPKQQIEFEYFINIQNNKSIKLENIDDPYEYAFNFKDLSKIRDFYDFMKDEFKVSIEMSQIESKENFAFVSALTLITSFVIFALSLITIIIYLINLLSAHLNSIKKNLGTYKAFGLSDVKLNTIYLKIVLTILCIGTLVSFVIIFIIAKIGLVDRLLCLLMPGLDQSIKSISVFNNWNLMAVLLLFSLSIFLTHQTIKKILNKTPGDLIYNRS